LAATLDQERTAKEEEIKRLTKTQEELSKSLQDEIFKGNITIQQVRDRLTINMVDRVLFDSGQAQVKPAGVKVLKKVSDILKTVTEKQIRIQGHTNNVPISSKLQSHFKTNWELSTARASTVVRYLIDQGSVNRPQLSAVGYAETHPLASNDSKEG
jgi:chemotaxis protein MotB